MFVLVYQENDYDYDYFEIKAVSRSRKKLIDIIPPVAVQNGHRWEMPKSRPTSKQDDWYEIKDIPVV